MLMPLSALSFASRRKGTSKQSQLEKAIHVTFAIKKGNVAIQEDVSGLASFHFEITFLKPLSEDFLADEDISSAYRYA